MRGCYLKNELGRLLNLSRPAVSYCNIDNKEFY
jgi:hypothetical protein